MTVMGERLAEDWTDELRHTGRVVFPLRRRPMLWQLGLGLVPLSLITVFLVPDELHGTSAERHALAVGLFVFSLGMAWAAWQFITQRPAITVDHNGIHRGRKFIPWTDIGAIGLATGPLWARALPIIPRNTARKDLVLSGFNVRDLPAFRRWLEDLLADQRRTPTSSDR
jgi:membrane protein YdbS with pleckstrin-like domain